MTCEKAFDDYLSLDKGERIPLPVTLHLFICPVCRTGVRKLTRADQAFGIYRFNMKRATCNPQLATADS